LQKSHHDLLREVLANRSAEFFQKAELLHYLNTPTPQKDNAVCILQNIQNSDLLKKAGFCVYNKNHKDLFEFVDWSEATDILGC